jgi:Rad3-related DNA helicase
MYKKADIVFMPYNYVIDPGMRDVLGDRLKDAVVLLDEAHNIGEYIFGYFWLFLVIFGNLHMGNLYDVVFFHFTESVCSDAASFDLPAAHLAQAINEAQEAFEAASMEEERSGGDVEATREAGGLKWNARGGADASDGYGGGDVGTFILTLV